MPEHDAANKIEDRRRDPEGEREREKERTKKWLISLPLITSLVERKKKIEKEQRKAKAESERGSSLPFL